MHVEMGKLGTTTSGTGNEGDIRPSIARKETKEGPGSILGND